MTIFKSWEEAEDAFYKLNDCISDDADKEGYRIENWVEGCGHVVDEEEHTIAGVDFSEDIENLNNLKI